MSREFDIPKSHVIVAGTEYRLLGSTFAAGGQASLYEAVAKNSDVSRRFLIKRFHDSGDYSEEFESEELSQKVAANVHQAILAAAFFDKHQRSSIMLKASSDCSTVQDILIAWEDVPPEDPASDYFDMGRFLESIQIVKSLLGALSGIHKHGVLHMDVSPSNVMWGRTDAHGTAYLLDFSCCTKIGSIVGERRRTTLSFSAPEAQIPGTVLTPAADIYSVGAVFLLLVAGMAAASNNRSEKKWSIRRLPGEGNTNVTDRVDDLDIPDAYKGKLSEIIIKATTSVEKRYQSVSEMLEDIVELEKIIAGRGMTPETLIRGSAELFRKECNAENGIFHYELQDDLITEAVDFDRKAPVDILTQNTILLGSGGSGKTTKVRKLWEQCLSDWKKDRKNNPIPVYVPLNTFDSKKSNWDFFIRDYITTVYFPGLSMDVRQRRADLEGMFRSTGKYVLFLDGINEAVDASMLNAEVATLAAFNNVTVIITSRNDWGDDETKKLFSTAELMPLNDDLILRKLQENNLESPSVRLLETLQRPMFLALYLRIKITDNAVETPGQILLAHHKHLIDAYKTGHHGEGWEKVYCFLLDQTLPAFTTSVGQMTFGQGAVYSYVDSHKAEPQYHDIEVFLNGEKETLGQFLLKVLHNCGLIRNQQDNSFSFSHQIFLEFYQAYDIAKALQAPPVLDQLPICFIDRPLPILVIDLLSEIWENIQESSKATSTLTYTVTQWLHQKLAGRRGPAAQIAVRNLVEILKKEHNQQLQNFCFDDLDLTKTDFYQCDIRGATFTESVVTKNTFFFGRHRCKIDVVKIAAETRCVVTYSQQENKLLVWNMNTGLPFLNVSEQGSILHFDISPDEKRLAICFGIPVTTLTKNYRVNVYDLESGKIEKEFSVGQHNPSVVFSFAYDSQSLILCGTKKAERYYLSASEEPKTILVHSKSISNAALSPTRQYLIIYDPQLKSIDPETWGCEMCAINLKTNKPVLKINDWVNGSAGRICFSNIVFSSKGHLAVIVDESPVVTNEPTTVLKVNLRTRCYATEDYLGTIDILTRSFFESENDTEQWSSTNIQQYLQKSRQHYCVASESGMMLGCLDRAWGEITIYDTVTKQEICTIQAQVKASEGFQASSKIIFSNNSTIVRIDAYGKTEYIEIEDKTYNRLYEKPIDTYVFNPLIPQLLCENGKYQLTQDRDSDDVTIWDLQEKKACGYFVRADAKMIDKAFFFPEQSKVVTITNLSKSGYAIIRNVNTYHMLLADSLDEAQMLTGRACEVVSNYIVLGTEDGHVQLWDIEGKLRADSYSHQSAIMRIIPILNCAWFMTISEDQTATIWDALSMQCWPVAINDANIRNGTTIISSVKMDKGIWGIIGKKEIPVDGQTFCWWLFRGAGEDSQRMKYSFSNIGDKVAIWSKKDALIQVCRLDGEPLLYITRELLGNSVQDIALSPDGKTLAIAKNTDQVVVFSVPDKLQPTSRPLLYWEASVTADMRNCTFWDSCLQGNNNLAELLGLNGAIVDEF